MPRCPYLVGRPVDERNGCSDSVVDVLRAQVTWSRLFQYLILHFVRLAADEDVNAPSRVQVHRRRVV